MNNLNYRYPDPDELWPEAPRRLPAPGMEPPYDAKLSAPVQGTLALAFSLFPGTPAVPQRPVPLRLVSPVTDQREDQGKSQREERREEHTDTSPEERTTSGQPDVTPWARRLGQALVEVLAGNRPVTQLLAWTSERVYQQISARLTATELKPSGNGPRLGRLQVHSIRVYQPSPWVAEVTVVTQCENRLQAAALRLEARRDRWLCTAVELGW